MDWFNTYAFFSPLAVLAAPMLAIIPFNWIKQCLEMD